MTKSQDSFFCTARTLRTTTPRQQTIAPPTEATTYRTNNRDQLKIAAAHTVAEERKRLARDIHDLSGQHIVSALFRLAALEARVRDEVALAYCSDLREILKRLSLELEKVTSEPKSDSVHMRDVVASVSDLIAEWEDRIGTAARFLENTGGDLCVGGAEAEAVFRLVQEALTNVAKHAVTASLVTVRLEHERNCLVVSVEDDGVGLGRWPGSFDKNRRGHSGVAGMRDRVARLGGTLTVESRAVRGTRLVATIPTGPSRAPLHDGELV
ncbi:sensor histidine kinase [Sinorhizobium chiapasense]|uniref:histidine kinase n=1 Tax=Sinorhizobium chiapasense TaxID=501572 RepID=A0ABZ2BI68_9HYPH